MALEKKTKRDTVLTLDGMLMIGSAGSNVGKTTLACALLRKFTPSTDIVAVKVTTIRAKEGKCPRGGDGCGVCSSLDGDFSIVEETSADSPKDTSRLLAAGANRVFWLRVLKTHLQQGVEALLAVVGPDSVLICESNSLRRVVRPALLFIVKAGDSDNWKSSAMEARGYADRIVTARQGGFDLDLDRIRLFGRRWRLTEKATAIIAAGGPGTRMRTDKCLLPIDGKPMLEVIADQLRGSFEQIIISANDVEKLSFLGLPVVPDRAQGQGPLMAIASALEKSASDLNFVVACDIPQVHLPFVRRMLAEADEYDIVIPKTGEGRHEPLFAVYRKSVLDAANEALRAGKRRIADIFHSCRVKYVDLYDSTWLANLNTMSEYEEFRKRRSNWLR